MTLKKFKKKYYPYIWSKGAIVLTIALFIISLSVIIYLTCLINTESVMVGTDNLTTEQIKEMVRHKTIREIMLVLCSITGTNLILSAVIEKSSKNKFLTNFFEENIFSSKYFYDNLSPEVKKEIEKHIMLNKYDGNDTYRQICEKITNKIIEDEPSYYFEKCEFNVNVVDKGEYFEKHIKREQLIWPWNEKRGINNLPICFIEHKTISGLNSVQLEAVSVNGNQVSINSLKQEKSIINRGLSYKNGYIESTKYSLEDKHNFKNDKATSLNVSLITRCPKDDLTSSFRTMVPCKNFTVNFTLESDRYKLAAYAFGFYDNANQGINIQKENVISVSLNDWIFNDDGICVMIIPKNP